jgi:hypothetical protein
MRLGRIDPQWFRDIQQDCAWIYANAGSSDVTQKGHVTNWTRPEGEVRQFSLFNLSGSSADTGGDFLRPDGAREKKLVFPECHALTRFAALFGPALRNLRLNGMGTASALSPHEENSISVTPSGPAYVVRFHLPIFTNDQAKVQLDGEEYDFAEGELYFFHHGCVHAASNEGPMPRYHLVLDCYLDETLFARVFPGGSTPDAGYVKYSEAQAIISGTPAPVASFVSESGAVRTTLTYGRKAPGRLAYYRKNYPSLFRFLPRAA